MGVMSRGDAAKIGERLDHGALLHALSVAHGPRLPRIAQEPPPNAGVFLAAL
jgi:hypothetical protein